MRCNPLPKVGKPVWAKTKLRLPCLGVNVKCNVVYSINLVGSKFLLASKSSNALLGLGSEKCLRLSIVYPSAAKVPLWLLIDLDSLQWNIGVIRKYLLRKDDLKLNWKCPQRNKFCATEWLELYQIQSDTMSNVNRWPTFIGWPSEERQLPVKTCKYGMRMNYLLELESFINHRSFNCLNIKKTPLLPFLLFIYSSLCQMKQHFCQF